VCAAPPSWGRHPQTFTKTEVAPTAKEVSSYLNNGHDGRAFREKFARERSAARKLAEEYFELYPKDRYQTEVESWRHLQNSNIELVMKRLREQIGTPG
jgi:hypothetical protein